MIETYSVMAAMYAGMGDAERAGEALAMLSRERAPRPLGDAAGPRDSPARPFRARPREAAAGRTGTPSCSCASR